MSTTQTIEHPTAEERQARGKAARDRAPLDGHAEWSATEDRADPVTLLAAQNATREPDLVPVRHGRMLASPFTFYRGAATIMAADLARTPTAGLTVQLCGDAHLSNFGAFASPERSLIFDLNDFDETLPGPFEYDLKRLSASLAVAARSNQFSASDANDVALAAVRAYREAMREFAEMRTLDIWYLRRSEADLLAGIDAAVAGHKGKAHKKARRVARTARKNAAKARTRDSLQALSKLAEHVDGSYRIVSQPPMVVPVRELGTLTGMSSDEMQHVVVDQFRAYRNTLQDDRRQLLERYKIVDMARKVVGVGSVGTRAFIVLLQGRDQQDPLFLQVKEATNSVLEDHLPRSRFSEPGERVVAGQRLMQAASDIFLGWTQGVQAGRHYYWRQLRDMKSSADVDAMGPGTLAHYGGECAWTLARAHARSGDPVAIAAYLGKGTGFDEAVATFSRRYADQNEEDYDAFAAAVRSGRLEAATGI